MHKKQKAFFTLLTSLKQFLFLSNQKLAPVQNNENQIKEYKEEFYMTTHFFLFLGANKTAFTASSNTVLRFSPVLAEHSRYLTALIFLARS